MAFSSHYVLFNGYVIDFVYLLCNWFCSQTHLIFLMDFGGISSYIIILTLNYDYFASFFLVFVPLFMFFHN